MNFVTYGDSYENRSIHGHVQFLSEKNNLYARNPNVALDYSVWLDTQLRFLDSEGVDQATFRFRRVFEKVSEYPNIYSITCREFPGSPRVLFFSIEEVSPGNFGYVLLTAFRASGSARYRQAIETAKMRRSAILNELNEEEQ